MWKAGIALAATLFATALWPAESDISARGRDAFNKRCTGCHSLDSARVGPALRGIFGQHSAADPAFPYSDALKHSGLIWDAPALDRWLADPEALVSGNDMAFRLNQTDERAAIIAYLKTLSAKQGRH